MPKLSRLIRRGLLSLLSLAALLLLYGAAVWLLPHIKSPGQPEGEPEITVWLLSNGVHTDIVVPTLSSEADWRAVFPAEHTRSQEYAPWLAIGLGGDGDSHPAAALRRARRLRPPRDAGGTTGALRHDA